MGAGESDHTNSADRPSPIQEHDGYDSSHPVSASGRRSKKIVGFSQGDDTVDTLNRPRSFVLDVTDVDDDSALPTQQSRVTHSRRSSITDDSRSHLPELEPGVADELRRVLSNSPKLLPPPSRPRPVLRRESSAVAMDSSSPSMIPTGARTPQEIGAIQAYERGKRLERRQAVKSAPTSRQHSPSRQGMFDGVADGPSAPHGTDAVVASDSDDEGDLEIARRVKPIYQLEAERLVRSHTTRQPRQTYHAAPPPRSGMQTPDCEVASYEFDAPQPDKMRGGILGMLLSLQHGTNNNSPGRSKRSSFISSIRSTPAHSPTSSGATTPINNQKKPWFSDPKNASTGSLAKLVGSSSFGAAPVSGLGAQVAERIKEKQAEEKAKAKRSGSSTALSALGRISGAPKSSESYKITIHIAETIARQRYLERLCRALMEYGAPTHRLEEYMKMSARVLEIEAQFLYIPGSMIISFDDSQTHTAAVRLIRVAQGLDLGKLRDVHELYKEVVHDHIGVEEATTRLSEIMDRKLKFNRWFLVLVYGLASASVGPFAFGARLVDLPIAFILGALVGLLQLQLAPRSDLYSNVFEITAAVLTSFLARAFGSINGGNTFCFSALAQSSIALILPGYTVLCASLELQSRSIVAGSVRMVYAIIYSLFLGFGIMIGTALYGRADSSATSATTCQGSISSPAYFAAVPIFTLCLIIINQGQWKQVPLMMVISVAGYLVNFYTSQHFGNGTSQIANTLGAFTIGIMANLYSRLGKRVENLCLDIWEDRLQPLLDRALAALPAVARLPSIFRLDRAASSKAADDDVSEKGRVHNGGAVKPRTHRRRTRQAGYGLAAAAMLPAIFVQVPSGLAVSGSLVSGLATADQINANVSSSAAANAAATTASSGLVGGGLNTIAFSVSVSVVQVAIGISCGLFLAAVVVYPAGKRRSGLFSF